MHSDPKVIQTALEVRGTVFMFLLLVLEDSRASGLASGCWEFAFEFLGSWD
jgi:hypothetical protein